MVIQTTLFTSNYNYRVVHVLTPFPKVSFIFVENDLRLWSLSDCKQASLWPLLGREIYTNVYFYRISHSSKGKFGKIILKCFFTSDQGLKIWHFS